MKMEEKKKGRFGKVLGFLLSIALLAAVSVTVVRLYPKIMTQVDRLEEESENQWEEYDTSFAARNNAAIADLVYGMYLDWYYSGSGEKRPGEAILACIPEHALVTEEDEVWRNSLSSYIDDWYEYTYPEMLELLGVGFMFGDSFYTFRKNVNHADISDLLRDETTYPYLVRIEYDSDGYPNVIKERGTENMEQELLMANDRLRENGSFSYQNNIQIKSPFQNVTLTIVSTGMPSYLYRQQWDYMSYWEEYELIGQDYWIVVSLALLAVFLLAMLLPCVRPLSLHRGLKANLPLELLCFAVPCLFALVYHMPGMVLETMYAVRAEESLFVWNGMLTDFMTRERETAFLYTLNGIAWFGVFAAFYICFLSFRQLFAKGIVRYVKENTLIGIIICFLTKKGVKFIQSIKKIDFEEKGNSFLWKAVLVNFVLVMLFCCTWFIGIVGAIVYSVILLLVLSSFWKKIKTQYESLLLVTSQMADGKTNVRYTEDAGMFDGLKQELEKVQSGFEKAVKEEVKSQRMKTELITNVSHDLKTPLTAIITYVDLLKNEELDEEERRAYIQVLEQKSARLKTLIEDLFEVSKATSGTVVLKQNPLDLTALLKEVQVELEDKIMASGIEFRMTAPEEKALALLDGEKTSRIFENLIGNIVKYGLAGSRAYVLVETEADVVRVTLKNISRDELEDDIEKLTERFTRGDASRTTEGSGLGLAIAKSLTEAQGGRFVLEADGDLFKVVVEFPEYTAGTATEPVETVEAVDDAAAEDMVTVEEAAFETPEGVLDEVQGEKVE